MSENADLIGRLQGQLDQRANPGTKAWWERYLRHAIPFRGVNMAGIRTSLHKWLAQEGITENWEAEQQVELAFSLIRQAYAEDKLAGILYLQETLIPAGAIHWPDDLPRFARLFQEGTIYDWNTCDWFCVRVLGPLAKIEGEACARAIADWCQSTNLWQRRASGVAFVNLAAQGDLLFAGFVDMLLSVCAATVRHEERFAQTGTGWVLRELAKGEQARVIAFIEANIEHFSAEGLRYATEKMAAETKARLRRWRAAAAKGR